jgi:ubiquinone biosynthesis monooxygenase Coq6
VWSTTPELAAKLSKLSDRDFALFVNAAVQNPIQDVEFLQNQIKQDGSVDADVEAEISWGKERGVAAGQGTIPEVPLRIVNVFEGSRGRFPLKLRHSSHYVKQRIALIG